MDERLVAIDEQLRTGAAIDLMRGRRLRAEDLCSRDEIAALTLYVDRRTDLSGLPPLPQLEALQICGTPARMPVAEYPMLEYYDGPVFRGALDSEALRWFYCFEGRTGLTSALRFRGPVEIIRVNGDGSAAALPQLAHPLALRGLSVWRFSELDLRGLQHCTALRSADLAGIGVLRSADTLSAIAPIGSISLERVLEIEPISAVRHWFAAHGIAVIDRHPFSPELRRLLLESDVPWSFPPSERFYAAPDATADKPSVGGLRNG